jgi:1,4-dihydroxy-2-naphthoate octaprenyltransferase
MDPRPWAALSLALLPLALRPIRTMATTSDPEKLNPLLGATGRILLLWAILVSVGWNL